MPQVARPTADSVPEALPRTNTLSQLVLLNNAQMRADQVPELGAVARDTSMGSVSGPMDTLSDQTQAQSKRSKIGQGKKKPKKLGCYGALAATIAPELAALRVPAREAEPVDVESREPEVQEDDAVINVRDNPEFAAQKIGPVQEDKPYKDMKEEGTRTPSKKASTDMSVDIEAFAAEERKDSIVTQPTDEVHKMQKQEEMLVEAHSGVDSAVPNIPDEKMKKPVKPTKPKSCYVSLAEVVGPELAALKVQNPENQGTECVAHSGTANELAGPATNLQQGQNYQTQRTAGITTEQSVMSQRQPPRPIGHVRTNTSLRHQRHHYHRLPASQTGATMAVARVRTMNALGNRSYHSQSFQRQSVTPPSEAPRDINRIRVRRNRRLPANLGEVTAAELDDLRWRLQTTLHVLTTDGPGAMNQGHDSLWTGTNELPATAATSAEPENQLGDQFTESFQNLAVSGEKRITADTDEGLSVGKHKSKKRKGPKKKSCYVQLAADIGPELANLNVRKPDDDVREVNETAALPEREPPEPFIFVTSDGELNEEMPSSSPDPLPERQLLVDLPDTPATPSDVTDGHHLHPAGAEEELVDVEQVLEPEAVCEVIDDVRMEQDDKDVRVEGATCNLEDSVGSTVVVDALGDVLTEVSYPDRLVLSNVPVLLSLHVLTLLVTAGTTSSRCQAITNGYGFIQQRLIWYVCRLWDMVFS